MSFVRKSTAFFLVLLLFLSFFANINAFAVDPPIAVTASMSSNMLIAGKYYMIKVVVENKSNSAFAANGWKCEVTEKGNGNTCYFFESDTSIKKKKSKTIEFGVWQAVDPTEYAIKIYIKTSTGQQDPLTGSIIYDYITEPYVFEYTTPQLCDIPSNNTCYVDDSFYFDLGIWDGTNRVGERWITKYLQAFRFSEAEIKNYVVTKNEDTTRDIEVLLSHNTASDATVNMTLEYALDTDDSVLGFFKEGTEGAQYNLRTKTIQIKLENNEATWVGSMFNNNFGYDHDMDGNELRRLYTYRFHFSVEEESAANDPSPADVTGLQITTPPLKTVYTDGETFAKNGMVVEADLKDGGKTQVVGFISTPTRPLTPADNKVSIHYGDYSVDQDVRVLPSMEISNVTISNGWLLENWYMQPSGLWKQDNTSYLGMTSYGENKALISFSVSDYVDVYVENQKQTVVNGICTLELDSSTDYDQMIDGSKTTVRLVGSADYEDVSKEYTFQFCQQKFADLPDDVSDYLCIGSQYTNVLPYGRNALATLRGEGTNTTTSRITTAPASLGNFGGYIVYYYENPLIDDDRNPYGIDFLIHGNSEDGTAGFAEPGQVWISEDGNTWYALAGSIHYDENCIWDFQVTYESSGAWTDNKNHSGSINYQFPQKELYQLYAWPDGETTQLSVSGIHLTPEAGTNEYGNTLPPFTAFGYVDVHQRSDTNQGVNPYTAEWPEYDVFDLAWAVDADGQPVENVSSKEFHYVKIQTASFIVNTAIGEKSTEVNMMRIAQPATSAVGKTDAPTKITVDGAEVALVAGQNVYDDVPIKGSFAVQVSAGENANIYINSQRGVSAEFDAMPTHGIVRVIVQEGEKEPWIAYLNLTEAETEPAVPVVEALISAIGTVTTESGDAISAARAAYDALSDEAKTSVTNYATLTAAEAAYADLTAAAGTDALIDAIGEVSLESAASITAAQDAYNALTDAQKALVTKLDTLTAAKAAYDTLAAAAEQEAIDAAAAKGVTDKITAIGTVTLQSESAITAAQSAYNALTDTQKALVTNLDTLTAAEAALEELKNPTVTLTLNANGGTVNGKATDNVSFKANNDGQALPAPEGAANQRFVGWEYGQKIYTTYVHGVLPNGATLTAVWEDTSPTTPSQNNITVSFRLIGSSKSDADIDLSDGDYHGAEYQTWIATTNYTLPEGSKAIDLIDLALQRAGLTTSNPGGNYIEGICAPATLGGQEMREFTNGNRSGWMYTLNGVHANNGVAQQTLANGDAVILHYVDDYAYEVADWDRLGGVGYPALGDSTYHNAWLAAPDVNPNAPDYSGGVPSGNTDSDKEDETKTDATATVADNGEVVLAPEVTDGEAKAEVSAETVVEALKESKDANVLTVTVDTTDADKVEATLDADAVKAAAEADVDLHVETEVGTVKVDSDTLVELAEDGKDIAVTVTTNEDGTTTIDVTADGESVDAKVKVELPAAEDNQVLVIVDADGKETVIKKSLVEGDKVYAEIPAGATVKVVEADGVEFGDVADSAWYADAVEFVASHELFQGTNNGFEPDTTMNRAMLVTVLYRLEDASASGGSTFADVDPASWYAEAVAWADETGIVTGTDNGFEPNAPVTREQIATILYRYANVIGLDTSTKSSLSGFPDGGETSNWASDAMQWAVSVGLFQGDGHGALNPKGDATRAQVATLFERLVGLIVK